MSNTPGLAATNEFLLYAAPDGAVKVRVLEAKLKAEGEYAVYRQQQDAEYRSDFDRVAEATKHLQAEQKPKGPGKRNAT